MKSLELSRRSARPGLSPADFARPSRARLQAAYFEVWREKEIVRFELLITASMVSRTRLLRLRRTLHVDQMLSANERDLLRLGSALATLTRIPFKLGDLLRAAAEAPAFHLR